MKNQIEEMDKEILKVITQKGNLRHVTIYRKQKYGEWIEKSEDRDEYYEYSYKCSICGHWAIIADEGDCNFCPNCGAKMKGAKDGKAD